MRYAVWPDNIERGRWVEALKVVLRRARNPEKCRFFADWAGEVRFRRQAMPGFPRV